MYLVGGPLFLALLFASISLVVSLPTEAGASAYCTNADLSYKLSRIAGPFRGTIPPARNQKIWNLKVDDSPAGYKQTIDGFGAAVTDTTVSVFQTLSPGRLDQLLNELMTTTGASFSLMRHTIGASDLSADPVYTYDDNGGNPDPTLSGFALGARGTAMAHILALMKQNASNMKLLGSSWSAPGWMKMNGAIDGNTDGNNLSDQYLFNGQPNYASQFAQYFVKYVQAFRSFGVNIDAITIQNEPLNSQASYPTMYMYDHEAANLTRDYIGPALQNAGLNTAVWAYDHNTDVPSYPQTVLDEASEYVDTVAWHCYASSNDWSALSDFQKKNPGAKQYMTECWTPVTDANTWHQPADFTIGPLQNWAKGVLAWTLATNSTFGPYLSSGGCHNCQGLVTINDDGTYSYNAAYYQMAQFSRFMPGGSIILSGAGSSADPNAPGVQSVASLNPDGTRSVVVLNTLGQDLSLRLQNSIERWSGVVPAQSVVTWVLPPAM